MPAAAPVAAAPKSLRVVLFGLPGAGKSSLLGALAQAAESQPQLLDGRLAEPSPNLAELRRRVYAEGPPAPEAEIVPYSFAYEPGGAGASGRRGAVVLDCDGPSADALIRDPAPAAGALAAELLLADAVVLAVDASAPPERLDADFAAFDRFLHSTERRRGDRTEVGGLPLFLVLTKCDLLARPGETTADWLERTEERKREIDARFRDFLAARDAPHQPPPFGRIHLHLWATAVKRPPLAGAAARPDDPYGVAELFRQCLDQAAAFRARRERSARRLAQMTLAAVGGVLLLLAAAGSLVTADVLHPAPSVFQLRVEALRSTELAAPEKRFLGSPGQLRAKEEEWREVCRAPEFAALPPDLQHYASNRLSELEAYVPWLEGLEQAPRPRDALTEEELRSIRRNLDDALKPPRPGWDDTEAGRLWRQQSAEADALVQAVTDLRTWYRRAYDEADELWTFAGHDAGGPDWNGWSAAADKLLDPAKKPPHADADRIPGTDPPLPYAFAQEFGSAAAAREQWEAARDRLRRLRDVGAALGLVEGLKDKPAVLVVPADGLTLEQAAERYRRLQAAYPDYEAAFAQGRVLPAPVAADVRGRARRNYERLLEPGRALVLRKLREAPSGDPAAPDAETRARWGPVREWLKDPKELAGWRDLARTLARLADPDAPDPVHDLASFLDRDTFSILIDEIVLFLPDDLKVQPAPGGSLKAACAHAGAETERALRPAGKGARVGARPELEYPFAAAEPGRKLDYAPGDDFYAVLPLEGQGKLRWDHSRSHLYRFEALSSRPVLLEGEGRPAEGVRLQVRPEGGVPNVPDLMPVVDLK